MKKTCEIEVDCANCALKMERATRAVEGVKGAVINFLLQQMTVEFEEGADIKAVMAAVVKACRRVESDCEISC